MTDRAHGISPDQLTDDDLRRELTHLHETRHDTVLAGSESALATHTRRMLALEQEFIRRFPEEAAPEQDSFDVVLENDGGKKIQVIKVVRELTGLGLKEAKDTVEAAPKAILEGVNQEKAEAAKAKLEGVGAKVTLK